MLSFERESGFRAVFEGSAIHADQRKFLTVMFRVAARAVRLIGRSFHHPRVKTAARGDPLLNFRVAVETLQRASTGPEIVAGDARGDSFQLLMGA